MNEITSEMARKELARRELARRQSSSVGNNVQAVPSQMPQSQSSPGLSSIPGDLGDAVLNLVMAGGEKAMQLPEEFSQAGQQFASHPFSAPPRAAQGVLSGLLEGGKQLYNLPLNINTYLASKGVPVFKQTAPIAEKLKIGNTGLQNVLMGQARPGDQLWQDLGTAASMFAAPEAAGMRVPAVTAKGIVKQIVADKSKYLNAAQKDFGELFKDAANKGFMHAPPVKEVTKNQAEIIKNSVPKYHNSLKRYVNDPTIENAHWAQSELGSFIRHLDSISKKQGLTPSQVKTYKSAVNARKGIHDSMFDKGALGNQSELAGRYNELRNKYRNEVIPYTRLEEISEVEGKRMRPKTALKGLMNDEEFMIQLAKRYPGLLAHNPSVKKASSYLGAGGLGVLGYEELKKMLR
jgi:hypothetical protein